MQIETTELLSELRAKAAELVEARETNSVTADLDEAEFDELDLDKYSLEEIQEFMESEDYDNLNELSKATLGSYIKKASRNSTDNAVRATGKITNKEYTDGGRMAKKSYSRQKGVDRAVGKLTSESEEIDESVVVPRGEKSATATNESELDPIVEFYANRLTSNLIKG